MYYEVFINISLYQFFLFAFGQKERKINRYNLELIPVNVSNSIGDTYWLGLSNAIYIDSVATRSNRHLSYLGQLNDPFFTAYWGRLQVEISQAFYLGNHSFEKMNIAFDYKSQEVDKALIILSAAGFNGKVDVDTFSLEKASDWSHYACSIQIKNCMYANLTFAVKGEGGLITIKEKQRFYIDQLSVCVDGKDIREITFPSPTPNNFSLDSKHLLPFKYCDCRQLGKYLMNICPKRILGLGETVHGSRALNELTTGLLTELATQYNYTHILLEISGQLGFRWNLFITDPQNEYPYSEFEKETFSMLVDPHIFYQFLSRLKQYNMEKDEKEKIRIYGFDIPLQDIEHFVKLLDSITRQIKNENINLLRSTLRPQYPDLYEYAKIVKERGRDGGHKYYDSLKVTWPKIRYACELSAAILRETLGERNYFSLLESIIAFPETFTWYEWANKRETYLTERVKNYLNKYPREKVLLWGHLEHVNYMHKTQFTQLPSLGSFLQTLYPNEFSTVGFLIGKETVKAYKEGSKDKKSILLQSPPQNSLEKLSLQSGKKNFIMATSFLPQKQLFLFRNSGLTNSSQLEFNGYHLPDKMMDAFIFISNDSIQ